MRNACQLAGVKEKRGAWFTEPEEPEVVASERVPGRVVGEYPDGESPCALSRSSRCWSLFAHDLA